jgi:hypothetical protein
MALLTQKMDAERARRQQIINELEGKKPKMPAPIVGTGPAVPIGFVQGPQGQLIPQSQMQAGLQSAVTPMAPVTPAMTNQQAMATAARVGTNVTTPMGVFSAPINTNPNYSASGLSRAGEMAQATQAIGATKMLQGTTGQGMTHEAQATRARQLEQDKINVNQGLASAQQAAAKNQALVDASVRHGETAAQAGAVGHITAAGLTAGRDAQGNPLPEVVKPKDQTARQMALHKELGELTDAQKADKKNPQYQRMIDQKMAEIYDAEGNTAMADKMRRNQYDKLYQEKKAGWWNAGKYVGTDTETEKQLDAEWALTGLPLSQAPHRAGEQKGIVAVPANTRGGDMNPTTNPAPMGLSSAAPAVQPAGNKYAGAKLDFGSEQEAAAAGLPPGTIITIAGRRARIK